MAKEPAMKHCNDHFDAVEPVGRLTCTLPPGHPDNHQADDGHQWAQQTPPAPPESEG